MGLILVVSEDPVEVETIRAALSVHGWWVSLAADREAALQVAADQAPKLVMVDSAVSGSFDLIRNFGSGAGGPGALVMTSDSVGESLQLTEAGADEVLSKPVSPPVVLEAVQRCLAPRQTTGQERAAPASLLTTQDIFGDVLKEVEEQVAPAAASPPPKAPATPAPTATPPAPAAAVPRPEAPPATPPPASTPSPPPVSSPSPPVAEAQPERPVVSLAGLFDDDDDSLPGAVLADPTPSPSSEDPPGQAHEDVEALWAPEAAEQPWSGEERRGADRPWRDDSQLGAPVQPSQPAAPASPPEPAIDLSLGDGTEPKEPSSALPAEPEPTRSETPAIDPPTTSAEPEPETETVEPEREPETDTQTLEAIHIQAEDVEPASADEEAPKSGGAGKMVWAAGIAALLAVAGGVFVVAKPALLGKGEPAPGPEVAPIAGPLEPESQVVPTEESDAPTNDPVAGAPADAQDPEPAPPEVDSRPSPPPAVESPPAGRLTTAAPATAPPAAAAEAPASEELEEVDLEALVEQELDRREAELRRVFVEEEKRLLRELGDLDETTGADEDDGSSDGGDGGGVGR